MTPIQKLRLVYIGQVVVFLILAFTSVHPVLLAIHGAFATQLAYQYGRMKGAKKSADSYQSIVEEADKKLQMSKREVLRIQHEVQILRDKVSKLD
ncbi:hypothetical protein KI655_18515 [Vibrio sp. D404a]|uniref:hypothetical protein n=1 Tax=unclassified Vibrio TaxID=2614977 RepID=UPI0025525BE7|nr:MULTISPECIES: hypothetical protein [unclassified Vibrio]MDK9739292.1 hypothetical protein [Vibrio sp. D404a]MDK9797672.1 hypothetical protein [Vibrio sp. D449a]